MKILLLGNNYPPEFTGGTEQVLRALALGLRQRGEEVFVLTGTEGDARLEDVDGIPVRRVPLQEGEGYGLNIERPRIQKLVRAEIDQHGIDVVHVHHWSHLSDGLVRLAKRTGCGSVVTLHDMWTSCGRFFRLPPEGVTCPEDADREACIACVNLDFRESDEWVRIRMAKREADITAELLAADAIVAPSEDCADACRDHRTWPGTPPEIEVLPHGLLDHGAAGEHSPLGLPLRVGTFGNLNREKGVLDLVAAMVGVRAELHLYGSATVDFRAEIDAAAADLRFYWHGAYGPADRHPALDLDIAVFPSRCRETYGLVVDEALHHGTPVIVADSGALPERVTGGGGLVVPAGDPGALNAALRGLVQERDAWHLLRASIPTGFPTIDAAVERYRHLYSKAWAAGQARR